jgi:hypothetical protein
LGDLRTRTGGRVNPDVQKISAGFGGGFLPWKDIVFESSISGYRNARILTMPGFLRCAKAVSRQFFVVACTLALVCLPEGANAASAKNENNYMLPSQG